MDASRQSRDPGPPGDDEPVSDSVAATGSLRHVRHFTSASLLAGALLAAALTTADVFRADPPRAAESAAARGGLVAAVAVVCVVSAALFQHGVYGTGTGSRWPARVVPPGVLAALVGYAGAQAAGAQLWPWVALPALLTSGVLVATAWPRLPVVALGMTLTGLASVTAGALGGGVRWGLSATAAVATGCCVAALMTQVWVWEIVRRVDRGRTLEAQGALDRERLRFAAELHDIQGHSLQVIALKSELAARLAGIDAQRAAAEMLQVQTLAREALRDTREVVHGYRAVALRTEIGNAVTVLAAAGVRCRTCLGDLDGVPAGDERLLALVVREATTNIIRHSTAGEAEISVDRTPGGLRLTVGNDAPLPTPSGGAAGGGLVGLAQRFAAAGGTLAWRRDAERFEVSATLPLGTPGTTR